MMKLKFFVNFRLRYGVIIVFCSTCTMSS